VLGSRRISHPNVKYFDTLALKGLRGNNPSTLLKLIIHQKMENFFYYNLGQNIFQTSPLSPLNQSWETRNFCFWT